MKILFGIAIAGIILALSPDAAATTGDEPPIGNQSVVVTGSSGGAGLYYAPGGQKWQPWGGVHYAPWVHQVALRAGVARPVVQLERYRLVPYAVGAPSVLFRDEFALAAGGQLGISNRWIGELFAATVGLDMNMAVALTSPHDRRVIPGLTAGLAHDIGIAELWLTGRLGYTMAREGSRSINYRVGGALVFEL